MIASKPKFSILVIDDDDVFRELIVAQLRGLDYKCEGAASWTAGRAYLARNEPDLILLDLRLPDADGLTLMADLIANCPVVTLTAYGSVRTAVDAMKLGAADYLMKPVDLEELQVIIERVLSQAQIDLDMRFVRSQEKAGRQKLMIGHSAALADIDRMIDAVASEDVTVHITGESGVGKEVIAREIHDRSQRASRNFVAIDCCVLQENLFESELFGHEKGAFTGADSRKPGLIEGAKGGTLFLDEIGEITPPIQAKLLRILETGSYRRLGGVADLHSDARILAATNCDLADLVKQGRFRLDLYYRLSAFVIHVPPLRERREDIPHLVQHFLSKHDFSRKIEKEFSRAAIQSLMQYDWPGNVRELRNVVERGIILSGQHRTIQTSHLGLQSVGDGQAPVTLSFDYEPTFEDLKRSYFESVYHKYQGRRAYIAKKLGVSERNVYRMIQKYEMEPVGAQAITSDRLSGDDID